MKQLLKIGILVAFLAPSLVMVQPARAAGSNPVDVLNNGSGSACQNPDATSTPSICKDNATGGSDPIFGPNGIVTLVVRIMSLVLGFLAVVFIIVQAIKLAASGGDTQAVASARTGILYAVIGLALAAMAQVLVDFVLSKIP